MTAPSKDRYEELARLFHKLTDANKVDVLAHMVSALYKNDEAYKAMKARMVVDLKGQECPEKAEPKAAVRLRQKARAYHPIHNPHGDTSIDHRTGQYVGNR